MILKSREDVLKHNMWVKEAIIWNIQMDKLANFLNNYDDFELVEN